MSVTMRLRAVAAALGMSLLLAGCGVPIQDAAEPLPTGALPALASPPTSSSPSASRVRHGLWFTRENGLVPVETPLPEPTTAADVLAALVAGPTPAERAEGLRTIAREPLTERPMITLLEAEPLSSATSPKLAKVTVSQAFNSLPSTDQLLLLGQVVMSLSDAGWKRVQFLDEAGSELSVPLPNGRVLVGNANASDFAALVL